MWRIAISLCITLLLSWWAAAFADDSPQDTILVLDASGSMWGQIDGTAKIEIAREAVGAMIDGWQPGHHLGLIAYGHRREGDCDDIETLIPVGPADATRFRKALGTVSPRGKTPLSAAVRLAARDLGFTGNKATVILVSDGRETCGLDPCTVAEELETAGVDFTAHVIGFDISAAQDIAQLRCLAEKTGGRYLDATDAGSLAEAMQQVAAEVRAESILFVATLETGGAPLTRGVSWTVTKPQANPDGTYNQILTTGAAQARLTLDNGTYRVVARRGEAGVATIVTIDDTTDRIEVVLGAGELVLRAVLSEGREPITRGINWAVHESEIAFDGDMNPVAGTGAAQPSLTLPAGEYRVTAKKGQASASEIVRVAGGKQTRARLDLNAGELRLAASLGDGSAVLTRGVNWEITEVEPDGSGQHRKIASTGAAEPTLTLPAGEYRVLARKGAAHATQTVSLGAGEQVRRVSTLNAAAVQVVAALSEDGEVLKRGVNWSVYAATPEADGSFAKIASTGAAEADLTLPAGSYRIQARRGEASAEVTVELAPGERRRVPVSLEAAVVTAVATAGSAPREISRGVTWEVWDHGASGEPAKIAATGAAKPTFTLPAGDYRLRVKRGPAGAYAETTVSVTPGETTRIVVPVPEVAGD